MTDYAQQFFNQFAQAHLYGSHYGSSQTYAEALAEQLELPCYSYDKISAQELNRYEVIIYGGGLYAGGVVGLEKTIKKIKKLEKKVLILFTVGLADPLEQENISGIRANIKKVIPEHVYHEERLFHLRGGIDYSKLSFLHKAMMGMLYKSIKATPPEERNAEARGIVETYQKSISFVDLETLKAVEAYFLSL